MNEWQASSPGESKREVAVEIESIVRVRTEVGEARINPGIQACTEGITAFLCNLLASSFLPSTTALSTELRGERANSVDYFMFMAGDYPFHSLQIAHRFLPLLSLLAHSISSILEPQ